MKHVNTEIMINCFIQFDPNNTAIRFFGNRATLGGDAIFGGCLSNCLLSLNEGTRSNITINVTESHNLFWNFISPEDRQSQSVFVEDPRRVVFCTNTSTFDNDVVEKTCSDRHIVTVYRGQTFNISMMAVDNSCFPSVANIVTS